MNQFVSILKVFILILIFWPIWILLTSGTRQCFTCQHIAHKIYDYLKTHLESWKLISICFLKDLSKIYLNRAVFEFLNDEHILFFQKNTCYNYKICQIENNSITYSITLPRFNIDYQSRSRYIQRNDYKPVS